MEHETGQENATPANDNDGPGDGQEREAQKRVHRVALTLAGIVGRRTAREDFERLHAANDNRPGVTRRLEDRADKDRADKD